MSSPGSGKTSLLERIIRALPIETGEGMDAWNDWLRHERAHRTSLVPA